MVKVNVISRSDLEWTKDRNGEVPRVNRNFDSKYNPMAKQVEFTRAIRAAKLDRMFAKPFFGALSGHQDTIQSIAVDFTNLSTVVSGSVDGGMIVWDAFTKRPKVIVDAHRHSIDGLVISPDGVACFSASRDKVVKMWDLDFSSDSSKVEPLAEYLGEFPFSSIDHHYQKSQFVTSSDVVHVWDVNRTQPLQRFSWGDDTVSCCRINKVETNLVACCMSDRGVFIYDIRTQAAHSKVVLEMCCTSLAWNPMDPNTFVTGSDDRNCYLFDMRIPGRPKNVFQGHIAGVTSVDFCPTGKKFAAGSLDFTLRIWDIHQTTKSNSIEMFHTKRMAKVFSVKWSPDSRYLYSGSEDAILRIWKADASKPIRPLRGPEKNTFNYMRSLKDKYSGFVEVRRITNQRNTPKAIRSAQRRSKKAEKREMVKEASRRKSDDIKPLAKRKVYQYLK
ncbi:WD40 repeat protein, predicted [Trypanosoma brucei gambiense DAL972]|uniref:DDB1- and CUL4-associated factor 13 n=1 Tax=Trypanosoma brucei gambiense (strain MHOM/CI/86/DAL972) TaxID=679716 RepID=C9ZYU6_TRYB9|nr:WD40 repeat protein, predicted [Trypanosoma brucei gambiense DAL972]CBH14595.1 WD40 repeat protein, predicted [Trypanosoma brucei gambiense DAL972]|eukprot:XP_011776861.1 WD40 repeat protein, predicted [Trypanosoma brucei gambiense DAL972]